MSKIKNSRLDQYIAEPLEQKHLEQLALKGLKLQFPRGAYVRRRIVRPFDMQRALLSWFLIEFSSSKNHSVACIRRGFIS